MLNHKIKRLFGLIKILLYKLLYSKRIHFSTIPCIYGTTNFYIEKNAKINIGNKMSSRNNIEIYCVGDGVIKIGDNCFFNNNFNMSCAKKIEIGDNCLFGNNVSIHDNDHDYKMDLNKLEASNICIGNNCWIGCNVIILRGVKIGDNCVIGAGTIVKENIPSNSLVYNKKETIIKEIRGCNES